MRIEKKQEQVINTTPINLTDCIIESIREKKGEDIVKIDLSKINEAVTNTFIICHAASTVQVKAISDFIIENVKEKVGERPQHYEGYQNLEWVLIDYIDIVVHIFLDQKRSYYQLEELWSDAVMVEYSDV